MTQYERVRATLKTQPKIWLVTGCAGFIGSNLLQALLELDQTVIGLDNFSTGFQHNLDEVRDAISDEQWQRFTFYRGDITELADCHKAVAGVDYVLHQAALGSVPRSIEDPIATNQANVTGFLNMLVAAKSAAVKRFVYAASSSTYGDHPGLPKVEAEIGKPLSPYAVSKYVNELYADVFADSYGFYSIGLRYFNVFGRRQNPDGAYAAVIPKWIAAMIKGDPVYINGDGETTRDFTYVENVVQANVLAAVCKIDVSQVFNIAAGARTSLNQLFIALKDSLNSFGIDYNADLQYRDFRVGDVRHSLASIDKASHYLGYRVSHQSAEGIRHAMAWYVAHRTQS